MTQPLDLDTIQARCDAATDGPWYPDYIDGAVHDPEGRFVAQTTVNDPNPNVAFIAAARADLPALIARVRKLDTDLTEMTHCRDAALRALHRDDIDTDLDVEDTIANALWGPGWDWEDERTPRLIARDVAPALRPALAKTTQQRDAALARIVELEAEHERLRAVLASTQQLAELDSVTCLSCGHLESAHDPNGDRDCTASGAQVFSCSCSYFIPCYPEPTSGPAAPR